MTAEEQAALELAEYFLRQRAGDADDRTLLGSMLARNLPTMTLGKVRLLIELARRGGRDHVMVVVGGSCDAAPDESPDQPCVLAVLGPYGSGDKEQAREAARSHEPFTPHWMAVRNG